MEAAASQYLLDKTVRDGQKHSSGANAHAVGPHLLSALILYVYECECVCV